MVARARTDINHADAAAYYSGNGGPQKRLVFSGLPAEHQGDVLLMQHHPALDDALNYFDDQGLKLGEIWNSKEAGDEDACLHWVNAEKIATNVLECRGIDISTVKLTLI